MDSMYCFDFEGMIQTKRVFCYSIVGRIYEISAGSIIITHCTWTQAPKAQEKVNSTHQYMQTSQGQCMECYVRVLFATPLCEINHKMEVIQSWQRILTFLNQLGFNFSNDRGLVEHCRDGKNLLKIMVEVIKGLQPGAIRSVLVMECYRISEDLDRHRESLPIFSDYLVARRIFAETKFELKVADFIHPDKPGGSPTYTPRLQAIFSHLIGAFNWNKQVQTNRSAALGKLKLQERESRTIGQKLEGAVSELQEVERAKMMERAGFEEKTKAFDQLREQITGIRTSKNEINRLRAEREKQLIDKIKKLDQCIYVEQANEIEVAKARKDLSLNAPEFRKQKLKIDAELEKVFNRQQRLAQHVIRLRSIMESYLTLLHNYLDHMDNLSSLEVLEARKKTMESLGERVRLEERRLNEGLRKLQEEFRNGEREAVEGARLEEAQGRTIAQYTASASSLKTADELKQLEQNKLADGINKLNTTIRKVLGDIDERDRTDQERLELYKGQLKQIERIFDEWQRKLQTALSIAHEPFNLGLFQEEQ